MGMISTRTRTLAPAPVYWKWYNRPPGSPAPSTPSGVLREFESTQTTTSYRSSDAGTDEELAKDWTTVTRNGFRVNSRFDNGHEFSTTKLTCHLSHPKFQFQIPRVYEHIDPQDFWGMRFVGPIVPNVATQYRNLKVPALTTAEVSTYGPRAIIATAPNRPSANLATLVGETVFEGLPSGIAVALLVGRAKQLPRASGSEYLNAQFGWVPLINDLTKAVRATLEASKVLSQWMRDSEKIVRRRFHFPDETVWDFKPDVSALSGVPMWGLAGSESVAFFKGQDRHLPISMEDTTVTKTWFSGAYQYAVPQYEGVLGKLMWFESQANHLLGTRITPDVLWELTPWSWLIDWISTIGQSIKSANLLGSDGLVVRYGYLMRQTTQQRTFRIHGLTFQGGASVGTVTCRLTRVTKERVRATPYGFTLKPANFSAAQWAILGALGLTKAPRALP